MKKFPLYHLLFLLLLGGVTPSVFSKKTESAPKAHAPISFKTGALTKEEKTSIRNEIKALCKKTGPKQMNIKDLKKLIDLSVKMEFFDEALLYIKYALNATKDSTERQALKLMNADIFFQQGNHVKAAKAYAEYIELYPGSGKATEYALYKETVSSFLNTLQSDQDQMPTKETLKLVDAYLEKGKAYSTYTKDIIQIQQHCFMLMYEHEKGILEFYLHRGSVESAQRRLSSIKQTYLKKIPSIEKELLDLDCKLALAKGEKERHAKLLAQLEARFPSVIKKEESTKKKVSQKYAQKF